MGLVRVFRYVRMNCGRFPGAHSAVGGPVGRLLCAWRGPRVAAHAGHLGPRGIPQRGQHHRLLPETGMEAL